MFLVALEDSVILQLELEKEQKLKKANHTFETIFRIIAEGAIGITGNIANIADLSKLFKTVNDKLGKIDILVANAAVYVLGPLTDFTEEMFDKVSNINFKGTFSTVQKALPYLNEGASVILISSTVNEKGFPNHAPYSASKAAVRSLARSFSAELIDKSIRVNVLIPGPVDTAIFATVSSSRDEAKAMAETMGNFTPIKRIGKPEEIAAGALYLASDESTYMVGGEILLDGGIRSL